jgi:tetratricopeptide (TPR) repeat protein
VIKWVGFYHHKTYNAGVELMMDKKFALAEKQFRKALAINEHFAEAHNNVAYTLRKQSPEHYDEALKHYNRSIALKPGLDEPYMYRGVLYVQMGKKSMALDDHSALAARNSIGRLKGVILENVIRMADEIRETDNNTKYMFIVGSADDGYNVVFSWQGIFNTPIGGGVMIVVEKESRSLCEQNGDWN